jgi:hypothetical protein
MHRRRGLSSAIGDRGWQAAEIEARLGIPN